MGSTSNQCDPTQTIYANGQSGDSHSDQEQRDNDRDADRPLWGGSRNGSCRDKPEALVGSYIHPHSHQN